MNKQNNCETLTEDIRFIKIIIHLIIYWVLKEDAFIEVVEKVNGRNFSGNSQKPGHTVVVG